MPETTVTAVVLRRRDAGESDRWLTLFSRELGKIDVIAKGARKGGSRLAGVSEPLMFAHFHLASGKVRKFVTQAQPVSSLPGLRSDYTRLLFGLALAELVALHMPFEAESAETFDDLTAALAAIGGESSPEVAFVWFAARLLAQEGQMPDWTRCAVSGAPLDSGSVLYSAAARGAVSELESDRYGDRRLASREALIGITKIAELESPPARLKRSVECCTVLLDYWQGVLDAPLRAWETAVRELNGTGE